MLDEFQATSISGSQPKPSSSTAPTASGPGRPGDKVVETVSSSDGGDDAKEAATVSEEDFAKQLQAGMANLIDELDANPEMQKQFEEMMQELIAAGAAPTEGEAIEHVGRAADAVPPMPEDARGSGSSGGGGNSKDDRFQSTIRKTMERMQASGDAATTAATTKAATSSEDDPLAQMMRELTEGSGGEGGQDFNAMLMNMMAQLTHKEILYEPMKELHDKFPGWMEKNRASTSKDDLERYEEQQKVVGQIVTRFERKEYSDDNEDDREYIVDRMQKVCFSLFVRATAECAVGY